MQNIDSERGRLDALSFLKKAKKTSLEATSSDNEQQIHKITHVHDYILQPYVFYRHMIGLLKFYESKLLLTKTSVAADGSVGPQTNNNPHKAIYDAILTQYTTGNLQPLVLDKNGHPNIFATVYPGEIKTMQATQMIWQFYSPLRYSYKQLFRDTLPSWYLDR